ncbi:MAG TPA: MmgE/PrpD family protein, partial [Acetobacteraceae bacterium]
GLRPEEVESVRYGTSRSGMTLVGEPAEKRANPQNVVDGQFSGPFVLSAALATGQMGWDSYRLLHDPTIRALLPKVVCEHDEGVQAEFPRNMSGRVTLRARGQEFSRMVVVPKGEPGNFLAEAELRAKFAGLADAVLGAERAAKLADAVLAIDRAPGVADLPRLSVPPAPMRLAGE